MNRSFREILNDREEANRILFPVYSCCVIAIHAAQKAESVQSLGPNSSRAAWAAE